MGEKENENEGKGGRKRRRGGNGYDNRKGEAEEVRGCEKEGKREKVRRNRWRRKNDSEGKGRGG